MKRLFPFLVLVFLLGCSQRTKVLNIYNWTDYIDEQILRDFETEYNVKINYHTYTSNEEMLEKVKEGTTNYDVIFPSDYMVNIMINEEMLEKIEKTKLDNFKNVNPIFLNQQWDIGNQYSVPYLYGFTAIGYNTDSVKEAVNSWQIFWDKKYKDKVVLLDDINEVFAVAFRLLGYSANDSDPAHLEEAKNLLIQQKEVLKKYEAAKSKDLLLSKEAAIIQYYSGDLYQMKEQDSTIGIAIPKEGTTIFVDNAAIPTTSGNKRVAKLFLNYLMRPDVAAKIVNKVWYASPNEAALPLINDEVKSNPIIYMEAAIFAKSEFLKSLGAFDVQKEKVWTELKSK